MMHEQEVRRMLADLRDEMIELDAGVSGTTLAARFQYEYPYVRAEMGDSLYESWLRKQANEIAKPPRSQQLTLPGLGEFPNTVTTFDGEGGFVYKRLAKATEADLINDERILCDNATAAIASHMQSKQRNAAVIPVMQAHGFVTVAEAIAYLSAQVAS